MQGNATLPYNPIPISNAPLQADDPSDALSEISIQQQHDTVPCSASGTRKIHGAVTTMTVGCTPQLGTVSLPPVTPRIKDQIISGEFINLATLLPNAMFSGTTGTEASKSLIVQLTSVGNDLSVRPPKR